MNTSGLTDLLSALVAIPSVNRMGVHEDPPSSERMVDYIERWLLQHGIAAHRQPVPGGETNLIATLPGPAGAPTILFDAHTDTVPAPGWAERAFLPRIDNNRLYGRGSCDTKGCLATMLWALAETRRHAEPLPHTVVLLASADEEFARTGITAYLEAKPHVDFAIVGEPTCLQPVVACKGAARWEIVVPGTSAHTSTPYKGVNAIARAAHLIHALENYEAEILARKQHVLVEKPTFTPTIIRGGSAPNVVPDSCRIYVDLRTMPDEDPTQAARHAQAYLEEELDFPLQHENLSVWRGADLAPDHPFAQHVTNCATQVLPHPASPLTKAASVTPPLTKGGHGGVFTGEVSPQGVNYGCHASDFTDRKIPAVTIGPGDIAYAHMIDEHIDLEELPRGAHLYHRLMITPFS